MSVFPVELERVTADWRDGGWLGGRRVHGEKLCGRGLGLAGLETGSFAHVVACGAGAGVAEPFKTPGAFVTVGPVNFEALAFGEEDADFEGSHGFARELVRFLVAGFFFFADDADAFVAHGSILAEIAGSAELASSHRWQLAEEPEVEEGEEHCAEGEFDPDGCGGGGEETFEGAGDY